MKYSFLFLLFQGLMAVGSAQINNRFTLSGEIKPAINNGTAYLRYFYKNSMKIDSALIKNGKFFISGMLPEKLIIGRISIKESAQVSPIKENISDIFLEPANIRLTAFKNLLDIKFTGSLIQVDFSELKAATRNIQTKLVDINYRYLAAQQKNDLVQLDMLDKELDSAHKSKQAVMAQFIMRHPASMVSAYKFEEFMGDDGIDVAVVEPVYNSLSETIKNLPLMQNVLKAITIEKNTSVGKTAIDFSETDTLGNRVALSSFRGKFVLIDFWASWCVPCRAENPNLKKIYEKYNKNGLIILGVSLDAEKKEWLNAIANDGLPWIQVSDLKVFENEAAKLYGISSIPQNILVGPDGKIIFKNLRGLALENKLDSILKN